MKAFDETHPAAAERHGFINFRRVSQACLDLLILGGALWLAYLLRFEFNVPAADWQRFLIQLAIVVPGELLLLLLFGVYRQVWRYTSLAEASKILQVLLTATLLLLGGRIFVHELLNVTVFSYSITILNLGLAAAGLLSIRIIRRVVYEQMEKNRTKGAGRDLRRVVLIGAGRAGLNTLVEIKGRGDMRLDVAGFLDDDPAKKGAVINGVRVLGRIDDLPRIAAEQHLDHVILSIARTSRENIQRIVHICENIPIRVRIIPGLYELIQDKVTFSRIRDIQVEDLLGRPAIDLDRESIGAFLDGKSVLVSGAGGSIGAELVRQLAALPLKRLILVERSEYALFRIERELAELGPDVEVVAVVADVCDRHRLASLFRKHNPQVVFHAAAHKHVPLMEENVCEACRNNIFGTRTIGETAGRYNAEAFVLISTDKAVNPTSVMGATKRLAELTVQNLNQQFDTRFLAVRFGNVIGSTGSVIETFRRQIKKGGPVTVTHPEMERYFMTIPEASSLVLQAGALGLGGEIFILDMGQPVKILELAREAIRLSGLKPEQDIPIIYTGMRPGEKLTEELQSEQEQLSGTIHPKIFVGRISGLRSEFIVEALERLSNLYFSEDDDGIRRYLSEILPEANLGQNGEQVTDADPQDPKPISEPKITREEKGPGPLPQTSSANA